VQDAVFGKGRAISLSAADGAGESFTVFPDLPFVFYQATLADPGTAATVLNKVPLMDATLELATPAAQLRALGTGGLKNLTDNAGSYAWLAVADPATRAGVVGGWLTHERGSGVVVPKLDAGKLNLQARLEYGRLRIEPGKTVRTETFMLGWFADARLGLEAWADAVAKQLAIRLPPMPIVYCTWYDNMHGGAGDAKSIAELSAFAAKQLKPYGFSCVQIDDGWQLGDSKGNGPKKTSTASTPRDPIHRPTPYQESARWWPLTPMNCASWPSPLMPPGHWSRPKSRRPMQRRASP